MMREAGIVIILLACLSTVQCNDWPKPPSWKQKAKMARYLVHYADWCVVAAVSPQQGFMPFGTVQSFADGPIANSSGVPYFYMSDLSDTYKNIQYNSSVSMTVSLAQSPLCQSAGVDPEDPTCSRVTLFGQMKAVTDKKEMMLASDSLFTRHPAMKDWPKSHGWQFHKIHLTEIMLLDYYGGASHISLDDYFSAM